MVLIQLYLHCISFVALNLGVPGQNSNQGAPASLPYEGFNPDSLLASNRTTTTKIMSKLPTPTNNYVVSAMPTAANRPDSPSKKKMINMTVPPTSLNSQQPKTKPAPLSLSNSHVLLSSHQSTVGATTGNNSSGTKSAFSVVVPPTSTSCGKIPTEDGEMIINRNMFLKDTSGTIDVLHSINNSNNQFRVVATSEPSTNNLHWKQTSSISEAVTAALQNSCTNTSGI